MKKTIVILLVLATCLVSVYAAAGISDAVPQILMGYVKSSIYMAVSINEDVLPFNIDSSVVKSREGSSEPTDVTGLKIGQYSLVTNDTDFKITVSHDKLVHFNGVVNDGDKTELEYRLYLFTKDQNFKSCLSTGSIELTKSDYTFVNGMLAMSNRSLYLSLAEADTSTCAVGEYESYITIHVEHVEGQN